MNRYALVALAAAGLAACNPDRPITGLRALASDRLGDDALAAAGGRGAVYSMTNVASGNAVLIFDRAVDGTLTPAGSVATGGAGSGASLGSQGAVALSEGGRWLFAVNAGSNDVSVFRVEQEGLTLASRFPSGGLTPISVTVRDHVLYVLNAGGSGNIAGFALSANGQATPIPGAVRPLSGPNAGPAEVAFSDDGRWLAVTEKNTNLIDVYAVDPAGVASGPTSWASAGITPFGFTFGHDAELVVSEASGTASSYRVGVDGTLATVSAAVQTFHAAPCWVVVTGDGRFAYTANAHDGTISGFSVTDRGTLTLLDANGTTAVPGAGNLDLAVSADGRYLYQVRSSGPITAYRIERDGHLTLVGTAGSMSGAVAGLAAQ